MTPRPSAVLAEHRDAILQVARRRCALDVRVFGSVARGDDLPGGDLDLLVRFDPRASLFDQVRLKQELEDLLGIEVDVVSDRATGSRIATLRAQARPI